MANDLSTQSGDTPIAPNFGMGRYEEPEIEWDLPPDALGLGPRSDAYAGPVYDAEHQRAARDADSDAVRARRQGDTAYAVTRETDAEEFLQKKWDWGNTRTWLILFAMFFGFLLLVAVCYYVPTGRHASPPLARFY